MVNMMDAAYTAVMVVNAHRLNIGATFATILDRPVAFAMRCAGSGR